MNLKEMILSQYRKVTVDGVELRIKKVTWKELKTFEKEAAKLGVDSEDVEANEVDSTIALCQYIFKNFIRDENEDVAIKQTDVASLPVEFCVHLLETFIKMTRGEDISEDLKKK